jgi:hypothetical protein
MAKYITIKEDKEDFSTSQFGPHEKVGTYFKNLFEDFWLKTGAGLQTTLEGLVCGEHIDASEAPRHQARYIVSVDVGNNWVKVKGKATQEMPEKTVQIIKAKYGSEKDYRQEIRRFLGKEFLDLFLPFLQDCPMAYSVYSRLFGGMYSSNFTIHSIDMHGEGEDVSPLRVIKYMHGAQFYISEDEFSFKPNLNSWALIPALAIFKEKDSYSFKPSKGTDAKLWANPLLSFSSSPEAYESFVKMLRQGPQGTTFAIVHGEERCGECTRFFLADDPITMHTKAYLSGENFFEPTQATKRHLNDIISNLRERNMLGDDPAIVLKRSESNPKL